ncbi:hypothetical protein FE783_08800 [Paenibacillus mesophilus]|uniref:hypothetical protein n=1 Tax=Paenibacillus mesophilus TaxID=2582849 RepID=UPI00110EC0BD|nr:hypothetical protein [Paenibacillus mesophilus]TMV50770.1 hypothetical protein FE783_08800 [Paenibacillus mesophilus]
MFGDEWWKTGINAAVLAVALLLIAMFYRKRQEDESWLPLKLLGYSVLGAFAFVLNGLRLPLGFAAFLLFLFARPKANREAKHRAAYLGLCLFLLQSLTPPLTKMAYERIRTVPAAETNMYSFEFSAHWRSVSALFELSGDTRLESFEAGYKADGTLLHMRYEGIERHPKGNYDYFQVELDPEKAKFKIVRRGIQEWVQYERSVPAERFFRQLDDTELTRLRPGPNFSYYGIKVQGSSVNYAIKEGRKYMLDRSGGIREIDNASLPVQGYWLRACGDRSAQPPYHVGCEGWADYIFEAVSPPLTPASPPSAA